MVHPSSSSFSASSAVKDSAPPVAPSVQIVDGNLRVHFDRFDLASYEVFLRCKRLQEYRLEFHPEDDSYTVSAPARFAPLLGLEVPEAPRTPMPLAPFLFDDQREITTEALRIKRFACWSDCGLGKTLIGIEWARQVVHATGGRVLIVTLNEIVPQWIEEAGRFYPDMLRLVRLNTREDMKAWCAGKLPPPGMVDGGIAVTNYEKFNHRTEGEQVVNEVRQLSGICLDESSRLKTGGGKQKWAVIKSARGIEFKLSLTATPAPNELMEFASQASFLEKMRSDNEIIWTYFRRDEKTHRWTVKSHARAAFFEFMAGWSIYVRDPRKYGWRKDVEPPPVPEMFHHALAMTQEQRDLVIEYQQDPKHVAEAALGTMFAGEMSATAANKLSQAAKGFVYTKANTDGSGRGVREIGSLKPRFVAGLIRTEAAPETMGGHGLQTLVWTVFDEEARILEELLAADFPGVSAEALTGKTPEAERSQILERFRHGQTRVLIARANMLGYGMNFQFCGSMVFSGWTFSYESFYQAVRRAYRHGQTRRLRVHVPVIQELEGQMWDAIGRKQTQHEQSVAEMEELYLKARAAIKQGTEGRRDAGTGGKTSTPIPSLRPQAPSHPSASQIRKATAT